jgi:hypothetical protein
MPVTDAIPRPALMLGWAGVIPFALLTVAVAFDIALWYLDPQWALRAYGACILSFLGGVQWGLMLPRQEGGHSPFPRYLFSVVPSLLGFLCLLIPNRLGLVGLVIGFIGLLAYDVSTVRHGLAPRWYASLRVPLTVVIVLLLGVAALT